MLFIHTQSQNLKPDHLFPSTVEVSNTCDFIYTPPTGLHHAVQGHKNYFTFYLS
jgi:hypothetical protein